MAANTSVTVPMSSLPKSAPSICIPRVFPNITWQRVKGIFEELGLGTVDRVDMVNKTNDKGQKYKRVFVHFKHWNRDETAQQVREKLLSGDQVKIVYDEPWFWKIAMSTAPRPEFEKKTTEKTTGGRRERKAPRVESVTDKTTDRSAVKSAKSEMEELRRQIAEQKRELEQLKASSGAQTPEYSPSTPNYAPQDGGVDVPPLVAGAAAAE